MINWPTKKLGEVLEIIYGRGLPKASRIDSGKYFAYGSNGPVYRTDESITKKETIIIGRKGTAGALYFVSKPCWPIDTTFFTKPKNDSSIKFIYYLLQTKKLPRLAIVTGVPGINRTTLANVNVQIPNLQIQKQIVERMDKIAEARKLNDELIQKSDELFQSLLHQELNPAGKDWEVKNIGEICKIVGGGTPSRGEIQNFKGNIPWVTVKDLNVLEIEDTLEHINEKALKNSAANLVPAGTVLVATRVGLGKVAISRKSLTFNQDIKGLKANDGVDSEYLFYAVLKNADKIEKNGKGATVKGVTQEFLKRIETPLPPLETQKQIVAKLSAAQEYKKQLLEQKSKLKELFDSVLYKSMNGGFGN